MTEEVATRAGYTGPRPGDRVLGQMIEALPIGTVLVRQKNHRKRWTRTGIDMWWIADVDDVLDDRAMQTVVGAYTTVVESLPGPLGETVEQYAWRFRDMAIHGAERAFGEAQVALEPLDDLDIPFRPTPGLRIVNQYDRAQLPAGTRVYSSGPGERASIWVKGPYSRWEHVSGPPMYDPRYVEAVTVQALADGTTDPEPWLVAEPGPDEAQRLAEFRAKAWERAFAEKVKRRWCGDFERAMSRAGISQAAVVEPFLNGHRIGDVLSPEQAATLMVGVLLSTPEDQADTGFAMFERVTKSTNRFGLRRVAGWNVPAHYAKRMVVRGVRSSLTKVIPFTCWSEEFMHALPVGSVIGENGRAQFIKTSQPEAIRDACWASVTYFDAPNEMTLNPDPAYHHRAFAPGDACIYSVVRFGPRVSTNEEGKG